MNILKKANEIVNLSSEEKERQYGPFEEGMGKAARLASIMSNKEITTIDMYNCMIALKLSRQSYNHKEDNLLDAVAYIGSMNNFLSNQNESNTN
jgi:peroxiredoxin family protein